MNTIAIIGAGAAGLMAAIHAAGPGRRVLLLERTPDGGRKILISGGGRCNVLPSELDESRFITASSRATMRNILRSWPLAEQRAFFEHELGVPLVREAETGKLFPVANKARAVRDALVTHAQSRGVEFLTGVEVVDLSRIAPRWRLATRAGAAIDADAVIVCAGGLSVPQTGSDGFGLRALEALGHAIHPTYPALTPLTCDPPTHADLSGISLTVTLRATHGKERRETTGGFLFTHRGYSGPTVLDLSDAAVRSRLKGAAPAKYTVQWSALDEPGWEARLAPGSQAVVTPIRKELPARLADRLLADAGVDPTTTLAQLTRPARRRLIDALVRYPLPWTGDEGYKKAEVTGGGVALDEIDPRTGESRRCPGLFVAGEVLDAFGPIGGYNFVWAWVTGRMAGLGTREKREERREK